MQDFMYYFASTHKSFDKAVADLKLAVNLHGFGILHIHDFAAIFKSKGVDFNEQCQVFEVCNPSQAKRVLDNDMKLNMALPCRVSVFTENGEVKIGMIHPERMITDLSDNAIVLEVAKEVDATMRQIIDDAK